MRPYVQGHVMLTCARPMLQFSSLEKDAEDWNVETDEMKAEFQNVRGSLERHLDSVSEMDETCLHRFLNSNPETWMNHSCPSKSAVTPRLCTAVMSNAQRDSWRLTVVWWWFALCFPLFFKKIKHNVITVAFFMFCLLDEATWDASCHFMTHWLEITILLDLIGSRHHRLHLLEPV